MSKKNRIRLFCPIPLQTGERYTANESQTHYLSNVMRLRVGDDVFLFDGINGEFRAQISAINKKSVVLDICEKVFDFEKSPDLWLLFAPLKKENTDIVIQKAVELGVSKIIPVQSEYTSNLHIKLERFQSQIIEAAEQCRRQDLPQIQELADLKTILENWPKNRKLLYLNETGEGFSFNSESVQMSEPVAVLVGPEGGFSKKELEILKKLPYTVSISLGKRILRAETAVIAALSCWQALWGDWK